MGHRDAPEALFRPLCAEITRHIEEYGVTEFWVGAYGRFDAMAERALAQTKKLHPGVKLILLLPYYPPRKPVSPAFDASFHPPGMETVPKRIAIPWANRYAVDHSEFFIAYAAWRAETSNTRKMVEYAQKQGRTRITLLG